MATLLQLQFLEIFFLVTNLLKFLKIIRKIFYRLFSFAGGTEIKVWDTLTGGKLLARMSNHHKTITCLTIASDGHKILSGSLDRHVKVYDIGTYKAVHTLDYPNSVLSLGISVSFQKKSKYFSIH